MNRCNVIEFEAAELLERFAQSIAIDLISPYDVDTRVSLPNTLKAVQLLIDPEGIYRCVLAEGDTNPVPVPLNREISLWGSIDKTGGQASQECDSKGAA